MNNSQIFINLFRKTGVIGFLMFATATNSVANDSDRITLLENEVQQLKQRLNNLEKPQGGLNSSPKPIVTSDGWKHLANWRSLKIGMNVNEVRSVLSEPRTVRAAGSFTFWDYSNRGSVTFHSERLYGWEEPRQ